MGKPGRKADSSGVSTMRGKSAKGKGRSRGGARRADIRPELAAEIEQYGGPGGLSAVVEEALVTWLGLHKARAYLEETERLDGPLTEEELEKGRRAWRGE